MFSPFVSKFVKRVRSARYSDTRSMREQAGITPFLRDSLPHRSPRSSLASRRALSRSGLGSARCSWPCSPENTRCKHDMPTRASLLVTTKVHRGGSRHVHGRDPCPTDGRTNLRKQKSDCKRLKTSNLIDPSHDTKAAAQFAPQVIESCTTRRVSRMTQCEKKRLKSNCTYVLGVRAVAWICE